MKLKCAFLKIAQRVSDSTGHPISFISALAFVLIWAATGPALKFSNTWELFINTGTTIITFLMVFLIQSTQNRDSSALHLKMDELIRATKGAHLSLMDIEKLDEEEFQKFRQRYDQIAKDARSQLDRGESDTHIPDIDISVSKKGAK